MSKNNPKTKKAWKKLKKHYEEMKYIKMKDMFASDSERFSKYSLTFQDILIDYSKNIINKKTITLLLDLANELDLNQAIQEMFS
jgi:glucose-6-phosphate isomerase